MRSTIQLEIAEPCHENWYQMTPLQQGRFCGNCQKTVVDFSNMSDKQLLAYFKQYEGGVCGRFDDRQLLRPLVSPTPPKPGWIKWAIVSLITFLSFSSKTKAQGNVMLTGWVGARSSSEVIHATKKPTRIDAFEAKLNQLEIKGTVRDENGMAIPFASITIVGSRWGTAADSLGNYVLEIPMQQAEYTIAASAVGYQPLLLPLNIANDNHGSFDFTLALDTSLDDVMVIGYSSQACRLIMGGVTSATIIREERTLPGTIDEVPVANIYPNPAKSGSIVTIPFSKEGTFGWRLVNYSGMEIFKQEPIPVAKIQSQRIMIPNSLSAGQYYIQVIDARMNPLKSFKLMVLR